MYTEPEKELIFFLADYFLNHGKEIQTIKLQSQSFYSEASINKLRNFHLIKFIVAEIIEISPTMISEREKLKAPPNYFQTSKVWWFSKPWAVALTILIIILPAIKTYIDILSYLFK